MEWGCCTTLTHVNVAFILADLIRIHCKWPSHGVQEYLEWLSTWMVAATLLPRPPPFDIFHFFMEGIQSMENGYTVTRLFDTFCIKWLPKGRWQMLLPPLPPPSSFTTMTRWWWWWQCCQQQHHLWPFVATRTLSSSSSVSWSSLPAI